MTFTKTTTYIILFFISFLTSYFLLHALPFATFSLFQELFDQYRISIHASYVEMIKSFFSIKFHFISDNLSHFPTHVAYQISWRPILFIYYKLMYDLSGFDPSPSFVIRYVNIALLTTSICLLIHTYTRKLWLGFLCAILYLSFPTHWFSHFWLISTRPVLPLLIMLSGFLWAKAMSQLETKKSSWPKILFYFLAFFFINHFGARMRELMISASITLGIYLFLFQIIPYGLRKKTLNIKQFCFTLALGLPLGILQFTHIYLHDFPTAPTTTPRWFMFFKLFYLGIDFNDIQPKWGFLFSIRNIFPSSLLGNLGFYLGWLFLISGILLLIKIFQSRKQDSTQSKEKQYLLHFFISWFLAEMIILSLGDSIRHITVPLFPFMLLFGLTLNHLLSLFPKKKMIPILVALLLIQRSVANMNDLKFFHRHYVGRNILTHNINDLIYKRLVPLDKQSPYGFYMNIFHNEGPYEELVTKNMIVFNKRNYAYFSDYGDHIREFKTQEDLLEQLRLLKKTGSKHVFLLSVNPDIFHWLSKTPYFLLNTTLVTSLTHDFISKYFHERKGKFGKVWVGEIKL